MPLYTLLVIHKNTRIVGNGWKGLKVLIEVTQILRWSLQTTVKTETQGWSSLSPLSQYNDHTAYTRNQDHGKKYEPDLLSSEDKDENGHPGHEDSQPGASRPTPGNHHPSTHNSHIMYTKLKAKLPKKIEFLGISPAQASSHQS